MRFTLCFVLLLLGATGAVEITECRTGQNGSVKIVNVTTEAVITLSSYNQSNASTSLSMEYSWDIETEEGFQFDGYLYKLEVMGRYLSTWPEYYDSGDASVCNMSSGNDLWAVANGTAVLCHMPCSGYFPAIPQQCHEVETVCSLRYYEDYQPLPAHARNISITAKFGETYDFRIYAYQHWALVGQHQVKKTTIFCHDELIDKRGFNHSEAEEYCHNVSMPSEPLLISGPPASFEKFSMSYDLTSNTGQIVFRWKNPYDVSPTSAPVSRYAVAVGQGEYSTKIINSDEKHSDSFFYVEIEMIDTGVRNYIKVTPYNSEGDRGLEHQLSFMVPEINACLLPHRYCAMDASCIDLGGTNKTSAICNCKMGYEGNGINSSFEGGNGCSDFDGCRDACVENANCIDEPPPSMEALCICRSGYFGDGRSSGSGCQKISSIVLLVSIFPLGLLALFSVFICIKRLKQIKHRSRKLSMFFASTSTKYTVPLYYFNGQNENSEGAFGKKYELDPDAVELKGWNKLVLDMLKTYHQYFGLGVLGRGNFGVVYKGSLKRDSETLQVAIKTTSEPRSPEMEMEFMAEIALIISLGQHENILSIVGCCTGRTSPLYLVTPLMKYGDLLHFLWDCREESNRARDQIYILKEGNIYDIAEQVASGLEYVTGLRIIHGDIAARNILVDEKLQCKISDFGLANDVYLYGAVRGAREKRVPMKWISPERMQEGRVPITWRSDVWSFGILLYEMSTLGATPFADIPARDLFGRLVSGYRLTKPNSCSPFLYDVMTRCWEWVPSKRPSFKEIRQIMAEAASDEVYYTNIIDEA